MKLECTPQELKELLQKETPVAGTTDAVISIDGKLLSNCLYQNLANHDKDVKV